MFTDNEQNNVVYRGYNPAFVRQVLAKRGRVVLERTACAEAGSMGGIVDAVAAQLGLLASDVLKGGKSSDRIAAARVECIRLIKEKLPEKTSSQVGAFFNQDPSGIRRIWRRLTRRQAA